jgi:hypothetical protein
MVQMPDMMKCKLQHLMIKMGSAHLVHLCFPSTSRQSAGRNTSGFLAKLAMLDAEEDTRIAQKIKKRTLVDIVINKYLYLLTM